MARTFSGQQVSLLVDYFGKGAGLHISFTDNTVTYAEILKVEFDIAENNGQVVTEVVNTTESQIIVKTGDKKIRMRLLLEVDPKHQASRGRLWMWVRNHLGPSTAPGIAKIYSRDESGAMKDFGYGDHSVPDFDISNQ